MPGTDTITVYTGEDLTLTFTMNPVVDISGWSIQFDLDANSVSKSAVVSDGPNGVFQVTLDDTDLDGLRPGKDTYSAWRIDAGTERILARGDFKIVDGVRSTA